MVVDSSADILLSTCCVYLAIDQFHIHNGVNPISNIKERVIEKLKKRMSDGIERQTQKTNLQRPLNLW